MKKYALFLGSLLLCVAMPTSFAADTKPAATGDEPQEMEQHGPHEHGTGTLSIAQSGKELDIGLDSPGMNIFGFEYMPKTDADKKLVADGEAKLKTGADMFVMDADAGCKQTEANVSTAQEKQDAAEAAADKGEVHSDVEASWKFSCEKPEALHSVTTKLFATFSGFHKLNVEWMTEKKASAVELEQDAAVLLN
jgi:hypothetical protein